MNSAKTLQVAVVKALNANGQSIDTGTDKVSKLLLFNGARVGFQGYLNILLKANNLLCGN